jgi:hypothetical protein
MRRDGRAAQLVEHVRALAQERPTINGFLNGDEYPRGMGIVTATDPAQIINAKAIAEGWPFRCDPDLLFARADLNLLRDVWHSHLTTSAMSDRVLFEVQATRKVLRNITIMERSLAGDRARYQVKYQGSYLAALMGSNVDKFVDENIPAKLLPRWHTVFDNVLESGAPIRLVIDFEFVRLKFAAAEAFIAPLSNGAGKVNLVLAAIYFRPRDTDTAEAEEP